MKTVLDYLLRNAKSAPNKTVYIEVGRDLRPTNSVDNHTLLYSAQRLAKEMPFSKGQRVVLDFPTSMEFLLVLWACLLKGVVAVPIASARGKSDAKRVLSIVEDSAAEGVIFGERSAKYWLGLEFVGLRKILYSDLASVALAGDAVGQSSEYANFSIKSIEPKDLALLQYTSGTTGKPKGVCITHGNIVANARNIESSLQLTSGDVFASWLPHFHDMGLFGMFIQPVVSCTKAVFMEPIHFLAKPSNWLMLIHQFSATVSAAPNFAFDFCRLRVEISALKGVQLKSLRWLINGSEVVRKETLEQFSEKFQALGLQDEVLTPAYGMAEATLFVSCKPSDTLLSYAESQNGVRHFPSHGIPIDGTVCIVESDTCKVLPHEREGEIWVKGDNVAAGYWGKPEWSQEQFYAYLDDGSGPYFRTGDIGFFNANGELFISGRSKDVIIIRGKNFYPQDIEVAAEMASHVFKPNGSAAFCVASSAGESAVLILEVQKPFHRECDFTDLEARVRLHVSESLGVQLEDICFVAQGSLPVTSSGKIQRALCAQLYERKALKHLEPTRDRVSV